MAENEKQGQLAPFLNGAPKFKTPATIQQEIRSGGSMTMVGIILDDTFLDFSF